MSDFKQENIFRLDLDSFDLITKKQKLLFPIQTMEKETMLFPKKK